MILINIFIIAFKIVN